MADLLGSGLQSCVYLGKFRHTGIRMDPEFLAGTKFFLGFNGVAMVLGNEGGGVVGAEIVGVETDHECGRVLGEFPLLLFARNFGDVFQ